MVVVFVFEGGVIVLDGADIAVLCILIELWVAALAGELVVLNGLFGVLNALVDEGAGVGHGGRQTVNVEKRKAGDIREGGISGKGGGEADADRREGRTRRRVLAARGADGRMMNRRRTPDASRSFGWQQV